MKAAASSLLVDLALLRVRGGKLGAWWGNAIGWVSHSPPHFHILYQHLHTSVVTTRAIPVYTESAIQKACQGEGSCTLSLQRKTLHNLFGRGRKGACELRGKVKPKIIWALRAALGGKEVTLPLYPSGGDSEEPDPSSSGPGSGDSQSALQREPRLG